MDGAQPYPPVPHPETSKAVPAQLGLGTPALAQPERASVESHVCRINSDDWLSDPSLGCSIESCGAVRSGQYMRCLGHRHCMHLMCDLGHNSLIF